MLIVVLVSDATILLRSIAGDAATKTAGRVNPDQDKLAQIDEPAADNTWHDAPNLSKDSWKQQAKDAYARNKPFGKDDVNKAAGDASQTAHPEGARDPAATADVAANDQQQAVDASGGAKAGAETLKTAAKQNVPQDKQNKGKEYRERTANYLKGKMPKERREQTIWRLKKMVIEIQGHQDCQLPPCPPFQSSQADAFQISKPFRPCSALPRSMAAMARTWPARARTP